MAVGDGAMSDADSVLASLFDEGVQESLAASQEIESACGYRSDSSSEVESESSSQEPRLRILGFANCLHVFSFIWTLYILPLLILAQTKLPEAGNNSDEPACLSHCSRGLIIIIIV